MYEKKQQLNNRYFEYFHLFFDYKGNKHYFRHKDHDQSTTDAV